MNFKTRKLIKYEDLIPTPHGKPIKKYE